MALRLDIDERGVATLTLNRPEVHNAFNAELIAELSTDFEEIAGNDRIRALILTGAGESFCAGGDAGWMRAMAEAGEKENRTDAKRLAALFRALDELPCPTIARVNGSAFGGGVGLIACCDIAVSVTGARFGLTEVRLGLIPATIAPFVIARIGPGQARRWMLTGERMDAATALRIGLVHDVVSAEGLDAAVGRLTGLVRKAGPNALAECKRMIRAVGRHTGDAAELDETTSAWIASLRATDEAREGLVAFLEKRKPHWLSDD